MGTVIQKAKPEMKTLSLFIITASSIPTDYYGLDEYQSYSNYTAYGYLDYGDIDKGKNKKKQMEFESKQLLSPDVVSDPSSAYNGHQCWSCNADSYEQCQNEGQMAYCQTEEFNCYAREHKQFDTVVKVHMGCQQTIACHREFDNNNRFYGVEMPDIAGFNSVNFQQCFPEDDTVNVSLCRQCRASFQCNQAWNDGSLDTDAEWNNKSDHEVTA